MKRCVHDTGYGLGLSTVGTLSVPVSSTIALDDVALGTGDRDTVARNNNGIETIAECISKGLY